MGEGKLLLITGHSTVSPARTPIILRPIIAEKSKDSRLSSGPDV